MRFKIKTSVEGTLDWFSNEAQYRQWQDSESKRLLWVTGPPGTGKSVLAKYLLTQLMHRNDLGPLPNVVAYFFCSAQETESHSAPAVLRALIV